MPRTNRPPSATQIYHVMLRGINHQQIFEDQYDYIQFIKILYELIPISRYELHAYCLMTNHVHLLIRSTGESLSQLMKRLEVRFVTWYNKKYVRSGHLFENRYKSEPVEDEGYYLTVTRYILQNPVKAGLCKHILDYPWSSVSMYFSPTPGLITTDLLRQYINTKETFLNYMSATNDDVCLDLNSGKTARSITDSRAHELIYQVTNCGNITEFQRLDSKTRNHYVALLAHRMTLRQLALHTGLSKSHIQRILKKEGTKGTDEYNGTVPYCPPVV